MVLLWAAAFFFNCMKMSSAKDVSSALNRRSRESSGSRNYTAWLARKRTMEQYMECMRPRLVTDSNAFSPKH